MRKEHKTYRLYNADKKYYLNNIFTVKGKAEMYASKFKEYIEIHKFQDNKFVEVVEE